MAEDPDEGFPSDGKSEDLVNLVPGDRITVVVDSALPDIVVVSFVRGNKTFQGALLDATKRGLPCGIEPPEPVKGPDGDKLATIASRFSYFQEKRHSALTKTDLRRHAHSPTKSKNSRPTVRLRPRQVLCSKCSSICNENNENVGRKRKLDDQHQPPRRSDRRCSSTSQAPLQPPVPQHQLNTRSQRLPTSTSCDQPVESSSSAASSKTTSSRQLPDRSHDVPASGTTATAPVPPTLIPKISRLRPAEINSAIQTPDFADSVKSCIKLVEEVRSAYWNGRDEEDLNEEELENRPMNGYPSSKKPRTEPIELESNPTQAYCATPRRNSSSSVESAKIPDEDDKKTLAAADSTVKGNNRSLRVLRKKRSIGLMEDLWDESVFEDSSRTTAATARATPVIKISFGTQGEGNTVLKIPSKIQDPYLGRDIDTDTEEMPVELDRNPLELPKSYEADTFNGCEADGQEQIDPQKQSLLVKDCETASSKAAKKALKKAKKKALKKMYGAASPARSPCNGSPRYNINFDMMYHRRKHKVKHKKKHKEERKHKNQIPQISEVQQPDCLDSLQAISDPLLNSSTDNHTDDGSYTSIKEQCLKQKLSISLKRLNTNAYTANCDYPVSNASSGLKTPGATSDDEDDEEVEAEVGSEVNGVTANGRKMDVGDVVWGKVHGFPWWPGKVLSITDSLENGSSTGPQAHVAWYGSSTSSLMSCDELSPFLETFKTRFNKKKKGPYKEAIRQASEEARSQIAPNSSNNVLNVCGSPREVNVLS